MTARSSTPDRRRGLAWRGLMAAVVLAIGADGIALAANNSVQGAKKDEVYETSAPTAILIEANSGSVLF